MARRKKKDSTSLSLLTAAAVCNCIPVARRKDKLVLSMASDKKQLDDLQVRGGTPGRGSA